MQNYSRGIHKPVRRPNSENYFLILLISFAASVSLTRLFLYLTGYPRLGGGYLHIAHVLWGGLVLFIASMIPIIFANRWVYPFSACLSGIGVGLFIDEVGKFITSTNDYFYPAAAPIIYAFFLLTVLVYLQIRRPKERDDRVKLYYVFDLMEEVLDRDLEEDELVNLKAMLEDVSAHSSNQNYRRLAQEMGHFLHSRELEVVPSVTYRWERWFGNLRGSGKRVFTEERLRWMLPVGTFLVGMVVFYFPLLFTFGIRNPVRVEQILSGMINSRILPNQTLMSWYSASLALEASVGVILMIATMLFILRKHKRGITFAYLGLLLALTTVNLMVFYFDQFSTILFALIEFLLLCMVLFYRRHYLPH